MFARRSLSFAAHAPEFKGSTVTPTAITPARFPWFDYSRYSFSLGVRQTASFCLSGGVGGRNFREQPLCREQGLCAAYAPKMGKGLLDDPGILVFASRRYSSPRS
jgi:hypothetical protein